MLADFEATGQAALTDSEGGVSGASRHAVGLRELALQAIVEGTARDRIPRAQSSRTRPAGELLGFAAGDEVDLFRTPVNKDLSGSRGPAAVIDVTAMTDGMNSVRWQHKNKICRVQDVRCHLAYLVFAVTYLRSIITQTINGMQTVAYVLSRQGYLLSNAAKKHSKLLKAILHVAHCDFHLQGRIGGRLGRGIAQVPGLL